MQVDDMNPPVTVISAVYNKSDYLQPSIASILEQTWTSFRYVIVDDGSTDSSLQILETFADPRIELIAQANQGFTRTMAEQVARVTTRYVAVHDTGDISYPTRLARQFEFLEENPHCVAVGSAYDVANANSVVRATSVFPTFPIYSTKHLLSLTPFTCYCHGSVMFRADSYRQVGGYQSRLPYCQDKDLWLRLADVGTLDCISDVLYRRVYDFGSESLDGHRRVLQTLYSEFINHLAEQRVANGHDELQENSAAFEEFLNRLTSADRKRIARSVVVGYHHSTEGTSLRTKLSYVTQAVQTPPVQVETTLAFMQELASNLAQLPRRVARKVLRALPPLRSRRA